MIPEVKMLDEDEKKYKEAALTAYRKAEDERLESQATLNEKQSSEAITKLKQIFDEMNVVNRKPAQKINSPYVAYLGDTFTLLGRDQNDDEQNVGVVYRCGICGQDHTFPINSLADYGKYLQHQQDDKLACEKSADITNAEAILIKHLLEIKRTLFAKG